MDKLRIFIKQYGFMGWMISIFMGAYALQFAIYILLSIFRLLEYYILIPEYLMLYPTQVWKMPWTLFSYAFIYGMSPQGMIGVCIDGLFLWSFGWQFIGLFDTNRLKRMILLSVPAMGLIAILVSIILNVWTPMATASPVVIFLVFVVACFIPDLPTSLFGKITLRLIGFAFFALAVELITWGFGTAGFTIMIAALLGYLYARQIKAGNDWIEIIWDKLSNISQWTKPLFQKIKAFFQKPRYKEPENPSPYIRNENDISQEEIDKILDKISEKGYMSLTLLEREKLEKFAGRRKTDN